MRVLILCGGQGTRLAPVLGEVPKALAPINGRPFLDYQLDALYQAGFVDIVLCTGVGHDQIAAHVRSRWGTTIHVSREEEPLGTAGALRHARCWVQDTVLVVNGDTFVDVDYHDMRTWHRLWRATLTAATTNLYDHAEVDGLLVVRNVQGRPTRQSGRIVACGFREKGYPTHVNAGVSVVEPPVLDDIPEPMLAGPA